MPPTRDPQSPTSASDRAGPHRDGSEREPDPASALRALLVRTVLERVTVFAEQRGRLALSVSGHGKFTLRFGDLDEPVADGFDRRAEAKLWFLDGAFDRALAGEPPPPGRRTVLAQGDPELLDRFSRLLTPPSSPLSIRFAR